MQASPRVGPVAAVVIPGGVLALLSTTVVGVAVPELAAEFPADADQVHWAATAALLAAGIAIPLSGWASLRFGMRRTWLVAVLLFTLGSLAVSLAPSLPALIAFRTLQGLGGGALEPIMLSALATAAGPARMGRVMGAAGAAMSAGPLLGPLVGGVLIESLGWRWIFAAIAAAGAIVLLASWFALPRDDRGRSTLDALGLLLLAGASVLLLAGLSRAASADGLDPAAWGMLAGGLVLALGLIAWVRRRGERAIVDAGTFRAPGFAPGVVVMTLVGAAVYPLFFGLPQFYRDAAGLSPAVAGLLIAPYAIGTLAAMPVTGRLSDRIGARPLVIAGALATLAASIAFAFSGSAAPVWWFAVLSLLIGLGTGSIGGPAVGATYRGLAPEKIPSGSTILFIANQLGGAFGVALFAGIIRTGGTDGAWTQELGTLPMVLPAAACLFIALVALRLGGGNHRA